MILKIVYVQRTLGCLLENYGDVCMYVYYVCVYVCVYVYIYVCACMYICMYVRTFFKGHGAAFLRTTRMYVCMYVCVYVCMCVHSSKDTGLPS